MRPLRYLYVVSLVLWVGGMAVAGLVVAPATFGVLEAWDPDMGRVLAGQVFGAVLQRIHLIGAVAAVVMFVVLTILRMLGPRPMHYGIRVGLLGLMLALTLYAGWVLAPRIEGLQATVPGSMRQLRPDDPRRVEFDALHGRSTMVVMATMAAGLVLLGWETRE